MRGFGVGADESRSTVRLLRRSVWSSGLTSGSASGGPLVCFTVETSDDILSSFSFGGDDKEASAFESPSSSLAAVT